MKQEEFNDLLSRCGLSKKEFAKKVGFLYNTVVNWNDDKRPVPVWVESWLTNYWKASNYNKIKTVLNNAFVTVDNEIDEYTKPDILLKSEAIFNECRTDKEKLRFCLYMYVSDTFCEVSPSITLSIFKGVKESFYRQIEKYLLQSFEMLDIDFKSLKMSKREKSKRESALFELIAERDELSKEEVSKRKKDIFTSFNSEIFNEVWLALSGGVSIYSLPESIINEAKPLLTSLSYGYIDDKGDYIKEVFAS